MRYLFLSILIISFCTFSKAQVKCESFTITYYKDQNLLKLTKESKAYFKKEVSKKGDSAITRVIKLSDKSELKVNYMNGNIPYGVWKEYDLKGNLVSEINFDEIKYSNTSLENTFNNTEDSIKSNYTLAEYPGGEAEMFKFIGMTTRYPNQAKNGGHMGTVFIQFLVKENGEVKAHSILRGANPYLDAEAWRVIEEMPNWTPATKDGKAITSSLVVPFRFNLR